MHEVVPHPDADRDAGQIGGNAEQHHAMDAQHADDQRTHQRRQVHPQQVGGDDRGGLGAAEAIMHMHAERCRGHDETHDGVGGESAEHGNPIASVAQDLAQVATTCVCCRGRVGLGCVGLGCIGLGRIGIGRLSRRRIRRQTQQHQSSGKANACENHERAREFLPSAEVTGLLPQRGAENRGGQRPDHHRRYRFARIFGRYEFHGGKTILMHECHVGTDEKGRTTQRDKVTAGDAPGAEQRADRCHERTGDEGALASDTLHQQRGGQGSDRQTQDGHRQGQRGQGRLGSDARTDNTAEGDQDDGSACRKSLGEGQSPDVLHAAEEAFVVGRSAPGFGVYPLNAVRYASAHDG